MTHTPWYAIVGPSLVILSGTLLFVRPLRSSGIGLAMTAFVGLLGLFGTVYFTDPREFPVSGSAYGLTPGAATTAARKVAQQSIPAGLAQRDRTIVKTTVVKSVRGYEASVTIDVDRYAFDEVK